MRKTPLNLFQDIPRELHQELTEKLIQQDFFRLERIVSQGQVSPSGFWYDQDEHEWVAILSGKAQLQIEGQVQLVTLYPGDTFHLPAHMKHRVVYTAPDQDTIWLALFWKSG
jgi:cupin 2 domain-containing protein